MLQFLLADMNGPDPNPSFHCSGTRGLDHDHTAPSTLLANGSSLGFLAQGSDSQSSQDPGLAAQVEQAEAHEIYVCILTWYEAD